MASLSDSQPRVSRRDFIRASAAFGCAQVARPLWSQDRSASLQIDPRIRKLAGNAPLAMRFVGRTATEAREWQGAFRSQLEALLGRFRPPTGGNSILERTVELPDHVREERLLTAAGLDPVPVHVLRPRGQTGNRDRKRAGILALHGHGMDNDSIAGRDDTAEARAAIERYRCDYGLELVRRGFVVAVPCLTPFGRRLAPGSNAARRDACEVTQLRLQMLGRNLIAENLRDCLWTLDFLGSQPDVDSERLGCVGLSLGGRMTMMTAALDPRVKVSVIAGALNCLQERIITRSIGGCQTIPGLLNFGDTPEISALIAPRTILWTVGDSDALIDKVWEEQALERMRPIYRALGAERNLMVQHFAGGHVWNGEAAYPLLARELAG